MRSNLYEVKNGDLVLFKNMHLLLLMASLLVIASCSRERQAIETVRKPAEQSQGGDVSPQGKPQDSLGGSSQQELGASIPFEFEASSLMREIDLDLNNLSYRFSYLNVTRTESLKFTDGRARVSFSSLPTGQRGRLSMEILEGETVRLSGQNEGVQLSPGANSIQLVLRPVTGNLDVSVIIGEQQEELPEQQDDISPPPQGDQLPPQEIDPPPQGGQGQLPPEQDIQHQDELPEDAATYFREHVQPILVRACSECHHPGQSIELTSAGLPNRKGLSTADMLRVVIASASGAQPSMPPSPRNRLTSAEVDHLQNWLMRIERR